MPRDITYLNPSEIMRRKQTIDNLKNVLQNSPHSIYASERGLDRRQIMGKIKQNEKVLNERTAPRVSGSEKDQMARRAVELEKNIKQGMPTRDEFMGKRKTNDIGGKYQEAQENAINKQIRWQTEKAEAVREWKRIKRTLDPENPQASNVEILRQGKGRKK